MLPLLMPRKLDNQIDAADAGHTVRERILVFTRTIALADRRFGKHAGMFCARGDCSVTLAFHLVILF